MDRERLELSAPDILEMVGDGIVSTDENGNILIFSRAAEEIFGYTADEVRGKPVDVLIPTRFHEQHRREVAEFAAGEAEPAQRIMGHRREVSGRRKNGQEFPVEATVSRRRLAEKTILTVVVRDVSERKRMENDIAAHQRQLEDQRRLVTDELNHRLMNIMALVLSVIRLSARNAVSVEDYTNSLEGRIAAIAKTQRLLVGPEEPEVTLIEQLLAELDPYRNEQGTNIILEGPAVSFDPQAGLHVGLVLHELTTNAAKYGALSVPSGRVEVKWVVDHEPVHQIVLQWRETGGPPVKPPKRRGFGTQLVERAIGQFHGANATLDYNSEGLRCKLKLPVGGAMAITEGNVELAFARF